MKIVVRQAYSSPPKHGAAIVNKILGFSVNDPPKLPASPQRPETVYTLNQDPDHTGAESNVAERARFDVGAHRKDACSVATLGLSSLHSDVKDGLEGS